MYITPRVLIQQEFLQVPVYREFPLPAFVIGPNYALNRYSVAAEKPFTALGTLEGDFLATGNSYLPDAVNGTVYDFPNRPAGGDVDFDYTKVFAEAVEAQYFPLEELGSDEGFDDIELLTAPSGRYYTNRVRFTESTLKTQNGYSRSSFFSNRDVSVGDIIELTDTRDVKVRATVKNLIAETSDLDMALLSTIATTTYNGENNGELAAGQNTFVCSEVTFGDDVVGQYITIRHAKDYAGTFKIIARTDDNTLVLENFTASVTSSGHDWYIGGVYNDVNNTAWEGFHADEVQSTGPGNTTATANCSGDYVGHAAQGILNDTYTVKVTTEGSTANARFSVEATSGVFVKRTNVALSDIGDDTYSLALDSANDNSLVMRFAKSGGSDVAFAKSETYSITVGAAVEPLTTSVGGLTTSGTYIGPVDMTYKITVERGGKFYDGSNASTCARLLITASDIDTSSLVLPREDTPFDVGSFGVQASVVTGTANNGSELILGDTYYIPVAASKHGRVTIVELSENLPAEMISFYASDTTSISAALYLTQKSIQIPAVKDLLTGETNWSQEDVYITIEPGITSYDSNLVTGGSPARLPIAAAKLFVEHRDLLQNNVVSIDSVRSLADVSVKLGTVHPDNPLAQGVYDAVLNAQNQIVYFIGVATNDLAGYTEAIKISEKSDKVYSFVPLTFDRTIQDAVVSHVNAYSTPEVGRWRIAWISVPDVKTRMMYDLKEDGTSYTATVTDDVAVAGNQYKVVTIAGAKFIEDGVRPNDTVRLHFKLSPDGKVIYDEYVVDHVRTNTSLVLTRALAHEESTPIKVQIVRNYTKSERANNIAHVGGDYNNRRVRCVFPDTYKYGGVTKQGYFAAAGLAGLRSGVVPHQGLTNAEFLGADDLSKVVIEFSQDELNTMAEQGIWIITQEVIGATPYVRHQLTTDERSLNTSEDSITTNVDNISYALKALLAPFIGRYNINKENIDIIRGVISGELRFRATDTYTARAGNQLVSFTPKDDIIRIEQNAQYQDRIDVEVRLHVPYPLNYLALKLIVG